MRPAPTDRLSSKEDSSRTATATDVTFSDHQKLRTAVPVMLAHVSPPQIQFLLTSILYQGKLPNTIPYFCSGGGSSLSCFWRMRCEEEPPLVPHHGHLNVHFLSLHARHGGGCCFEWSVSVSCQLTLSELSKLLFISTYRVQQRKSQCVPSLSCDGRSFSWDFSRLYAHAAPRPSSL
jgi:hypothetical protein